MSGVCPPKFDPRWKLLEHTFGEDGALKIYLAYNSSLPTMQEIETLLIPFKGKLMVGKEKLFLDTYGKTISVDNKKELSKFKNKIGNKVVLDISVEELIDYYKLEDNAGMPKVFNPKAIDKIEQDILTFFPTIKLKRVAIEGGELVTLHRILPGETFAAIYDDEGNYISDDMDDFDYVDFVEEDFNFDETITQEDILDLNEDYNIYLDENEGHYAHNLIMDITFGKYYRLKQGQLHLFYTALKKARESYDIKQIEYYQDLYNNKKKELKEIADAISFEQLERLLLKDMADIEKIINSPNPTLTALEFAFETSKFWSVPEQSYLTDDIRKSLIMNKVTNYANIFNNLNTVVYNKQLDHLEKLIQKELSDSDFDIRKYLKTMQDVDFATANIRDISMVSNALFDVVHKLHNRANLHFLEERDRLFKEIEEVFSNIDSYDPFIEKREDGTLTNRIVSAYSYKYKDLKNKYYDDARKNNTWGAYYSWIRDNEWVFDVNLLFPGTTLTEKEEKEKEILIAKLKDAIGEDEYENLYLAAKQKIEEYKIYKEAAFKRIENDSILSSREKEEAKTKWLHIFSPYKYLVKTGKGIIPLLNGELEPQKGSNFLISIPAKYKDTGATGYYNEDFNKIKQDPKLFKAYTYFTNLMEEYYEYLTPAQKYNMHQFGLPFLKKTTYEIFKESGLAFSKSFQNIIKDLKINISIEQESNTSSASINPLTNEEKKQLAVYGLEFGQKFVTQYVNAKVKLLASTNQVPTHEIAQYKKEALDILARERTYNLEKIAKQYIDGVLAFKHKIGLDNVVRLTSNVLKSEQETEFTNKGIVRKVTRIGNSLYSDNKSFKNLKEMYAHYESVFFGKSMEYGKPKQRILPGYKEFKVSEKTKNKIRKLRIRTKEEEQLLENLFETLDNLYDLHKNPRWNGEGKLNEEQYKLRKNEVLNDIYELGRIRSAAKMVKQAMLFRQFQGMGWNVNSAITNTLFGFISNKSMAEDGRFYNNDEITYAYSVLWTSPFDVINRVKNKVITFSDEAEKIRVIVEKINLLGNSLNELNAKSGNANINSVANPMILQELSEYPNYAAVFIAMALHKKIKLDDNTEVSVWQVLDSKGEIKDEYKQYYTKEQYFDFVGDVKKVAKMNHGNYDTISPILINKTVGGQAFTQFKRWLFELTMTKFQDYRYDRVLNQEFRGIYRTILGFDNKDTYFNLEDDTNRLQKLVVMLKAIIVKMSNSTIGIIPGLRVQGEDFKSYVGVGTFSEVDAANMRRIITELAYIMLVAGTSLLLRILLEGLDDEEEEIDFRKGAYISLLNQLSRVYTDLVLYTNPDEQAKIIKTPFPVLSLVSDAYSILEASLETLGGNWTYRSGPYKDYPRILREVGEFLPFSSSVHKIYVTQDKLFNPNIGKPPVISTLIFEED